MSSYSGTPLFADQDEPAARTAGGTVVSLNTLGYAVTPLLSSRLKIEMHEVRATVPVERSAAVARIALDAGIENVSVYEIFVHGPETRRHVVSAEVPTPKARDFVHALLDSSCLVGPDCSISLRELRAIVNRKPLSEMTQPMVEPGPDVIEDLWLMSHVTPSYLGRAAGGAILMANGVVHNSAVEIVVATLILPFLSQVLAIGFGAWCGDRGCCAKGRSRSQRVLCSPTRWEWWWRGSRAGRSRSTISRVRWRASRFRR